MVYFREWWGEQTAAKQASVRALVAAKRLVFLTGGLCMNDEAIAHQAAVVAGCCDTSDDDDSWTALLEASNTVLEASRTVEAQWMEMADELPQVGA